MSRLESLTRFVCDAIPERIAGIKFASEMSDIEYIMRQRDLGLGAYQLAIQRYSVFLSWERLPYRLFDPNNITALVTVWITENEGEDPNGQAIEITAPATSVEVIDDKVADMTVTLTISEPLIIRENPKGCIPFDGKRWELATAEVWYAEEVSVRVTDVNSEPLT
ncbi:phage tail protein [Lelliottia amnigena]|uniref:Phage tail protein n=1 Tax=Lelliottia amnigena TaxID=61646 RepID=A0AAP2AI07_LELAM|nr:phage tail protein [Lelliottia amnigena]MBL5901438.1 phage tail protein [Lelliottia amnigena]MBL5936837.1 phage tail protein [Lelliottia amnigena]